MNLAIPALEVVAPYEVRGDLRDVCQHVCAAHIQAGHCWQISGPGCIFERVEARFEDQEDVTAHPMQRLLLREEQVFPFLFSHHAKYTSFPKS